ncbi:MAG: hypothetical protein J6S81_01710 [Treponema sp.]|nr:hypothetical protein [Treponema sp.]
MPEKEIGFPQRKFLSVLPGKRTFLLNIKIQMPIFKGYGIPVPDSVWKRRFLRFWRLCKVSFQMLLPAGEKTNGTKKNIMDFNRSGSFFMRGHWSRVPFLWQFPEE